MGDYNHEAIELAPFHSNARNDVKEGSTFTWRRSANPECLSMRSMASRAHACTCSSSTDTSKRPLEKVSEGPLGDSTFQSFPERSEDIQALCRASVDALQHAASRRDQWRCLSAPPERNERCRFTVRTTSDTRWVRPGQKYDRIAEVGRHGRRDSDSGRGAGAL